MSGLSDADRAALDSALADFADELNGYVIDYSKALSIYATVESIVAAHVEAVRAEYSPVALTAVWAQGKAEGQAENALAVRVGSVLDTWTHGSRCATWYDTARDCDCWKRDLRAALAPNG